MTNIFLDPFYADTLTQYGSDTVPIEALVWQRFVVDNGIDVSLPLSSAQKAAFSIYLKVYQGWDLSAKTLTSTIGLPGPKYDACFQNESGVDLFSGISVIQKKDLWNGFLEAYALDDAALRSQDLSALFSTYLRSQLRKLNEYLNLPANQQSAITSPEQVEQIALWNRFLSVYGYSPLDISTNEDKAKFSAFVQQYLLWGIDAETMQSTNTLPSGSGADFFLTYLHSFFGKYSDPELTDLWNQFLSTQGLSTNPVDLTPLRKPFVDFVKNLRTTQYSIEAATAISPNESAQRTVFSDVMASLSKMLGASEAMVRTSAAALTIYGEWQKELTKMMTSAPSLVSVPEKDLETSTDTTLRLPPGDIPTSWDLDKFTFGYGKITLNEIIAWEYDSITKEDATSTSISFGDDVMGRYTLAKTTNDSGKPVIRATFTNGTIGDDGTYAITGHSDIEINSDTNINPDREKDNRFYTFDQWVTEIGTSFKTIFNNSPDAVTSLKPVDGKYPLALQGRFLKDSEMFVVSSSVKGGDKTLRERFLEAGLGNIPYISHYPEPGWANINQGFVEALNTLINKPIQPAYLEVGLIKYMLAPKPAKFCMRTNQNADGTWYYQVVTIPPDQDPVTYVDDSFHYGTPPDVQYWFPSDGKGTFSVKTVPTGLQDRQLQNIKIQQYVNEIRARRQTVQQESGKIQSVLQNGRQAINKISSLWTSVLQAISTVVLSIYSKR